MAVTLFILSGTAFLAFLAFAAFALVVVSIHRTERARLAEAKGKRSGVIARRVLTGISTEGKEDSR